MPRSVAAAVLGAFALTAAIGLGTAPSAIASTDTLWAWGDNTTGQFGDGTTVSANAPVATTGGYSFASIAAGNYHACGLIGTGAAYCWGDNTYGQLGDGTTGATTAPVAVTGGYSFVSIAAGGEHTCAMTSAGAAYCWGYNVNGQIGDGTTVAKSTPVAVSGGHAFVSIAAGSDHSCGVTGSGAAYCWGDNLIGQIGDGTTLDRTTPVAVSGGYSFVSITAGYTHTCGVQGNGFALCWGENGDGQLGDGTTISSSTPLGVNGPGLSAPPIFASLSAGYRYTCGVTGGGAAYCWGDNRDGKLGDNSTTARLNPTLVAGGHSFTSLAAGYRHTCGVTGGGAGYCWGNNTYGQLGDGTTVATTSPVAVNGGHSFNAIAVSDRERSFSFGLTSVAGDSSGAFTSFSFFLPDGRECSSISPMRVQVGAMVELPGADALCRTMAGATVAGWTIPVPAGFTGAGSSSLPFRPGMTVRVIEGQRFTVVPFEPILTVQYDANVATGDICTSNDVTHARGRVADVWVPRADLADARTPGMAACTPPGHILTGWNTSGHGGGASIGVGEALPATWADSGDNLRHLYAVWQVHDSA